jgi:predicted RNA-binding Zn-ribbon protein involved in translation (DUF1610 family)
MNKYQEALENIKQYIIETCYDDEIYETSISDLYPSEFSILQKLVDKATPKKLKNKTDKDGRLLWVCPTCGDVYMKFWNDVETISCRKHCDNCGQKLDWSDNDE